MNYRLTTGASLAFVLLLGGAWAAEALKSGPQTGDPLRVPFNPLNVTGDHAGTKTCQV